MSWGNEARRGPLLLVLGGVLAACAAFTGWAWLQFQQASEQARALAAAAAEISEQVSADNWSAVQAAVPVAVLQADDLLQTTDTPTWRLISALPVIGGRAEALRGAAQALSPVLRAATSVSESAVEVRHAWDSGAEIDPATADAFARQVSRLGGAVRLARARVITVSQQGVPPDAAASLAKVSTGLDDLDQRLNSLEASMRMLGWAQPYRWLVVLLDPTRIRGSGGAVQAMAVVTLDGGRITEVRAGPEPAGGSIEGVFIPLFNEWQGVLGTWSGMSAHPDFAVTGAITLAVTAAKGTPSDGVIGIGPRTLSTLTSRPMTSSKDLQVALSGQVGKALSPELIYTISDGRSAPDIEAWSPQAAEHAVLESLGMIDSLTQMSPHSIAVSLNDTSPTRRSTVHGTVAYVSQVCRETVTDTSEVRVTITNPDSKSPVFMLHVIGPPDAELKQAFLDGQQTTTASHVENDRPTWWVYVTVPKQSSVTFVLTFTGQGHASERAQVLVGPRAALTATVIAASSCK